MRTTAEIKEKIVDKAWEILESAVSAEECLPPHKEYLIPGDLLQELANLFQELDQLES